MAIRAERLRTQAMSNDQPESRSSAWIERIKSYPRRLNEYFHEVRIEMHQVTWPSREQVISTTFVVIIAVAFFGLFFFGVDSTVGYVLERIFSYFRR